MLNMTQGNIYKHLIKYAVPMILGNILQLTYNAVDSMIIGKCLGEDALAAVSTSNPIMTIMILGVSGLSMGGSVIMSKYYGAGDLKNVKKEFSTTFLFSLICSLVIFVVGFVLSEQILILVNTPEEILGLAESYLQTIFVGFLFTFQYNIMAAAMRSIGDARSPVIFLFISVIINILLDIVFVYFFEWGVVGAGVATAIAEAVSVLLCIIFIYKKMDMLKLGRKDLVMDKVLLKETLQIGSLTALQQAVQPIGKILIQSVINAEGVIAIGAFNAVCRLDDFACIPSQSIGSAIMTCTAQNRGADKYDRVRETLTKGFVVALSYFPIIFVVTMLLKTPAVKLLTPKGSQLMIDMAVSYLTVKAWFFIMPCIMNAIQGFFRGMAQMKVVLIATVIQISIRAIIVYLFVPKMGIVGEAYACMIGWTIMFIFEFGYYFYKKPLKNT